jgi:hypothetical protein
VEKFTTDLGLDNIVVDFNAYAVTTATPVPLDCGLVQYELKAADDEPAPSWAKLNRESTTINLDLSKEEQPFSTSLFVHAKL